MLAQSKHTPFLRGLDVPNKSFSMPHPQSLDSFYAVVPNRYEILAPFVRPPSAHEQQPLPLFHVFESHPSLPVGPAELLDAVSLRRRLGKINEEGFIKFVDRKDVLA